MSDEPSESQHHFPRWAPRLKAMKYGGEIGVTHMNKLMQTGKIRAKKDGKKVIVDLNSIDQYYAALPNVAAGAAADIKSSDFVDNIENP